ncbi:granzyme B-like [Chroicocephalus ridibundus]|uniref:granzyme B-like n=1 Tax=Chroicocephalus ridibundus TaxID=1192867 RepID=UPI002FDEC0F3
MLLLLLLASAFLLVPWAGVGRIIGGSEAKPHSWPYMAYLSIRNELDDNIRCGGFLIRPDAVLSSAHCKNMNITVILRADNVNKGKPSQQAFHVGHWVIHPNYSSHPFKNDIMLLKVCHHTSLLTEGSPPACLPKPMNLFPFLCLLAKFFTDGLCSQRSLETTELDDAMAYDHHEYQTSCGR